MGGGRIVFVGNLPLDTREQELEDLFFKYGKIVKIDLKLPSRPPGFAFVEFEEVEDAERAVQGRDNHDFFGHKLRVRGVGSSMANRMVWGLGGAWFVPLTQAHEELQDQRCLGFFACKESADFACSAHPQAGSSEPTVPLKRQSKHEHH